MAFYNHVEGDLSDFRCNNCQRNEGANRKAIPSDSDNITLWRRRKQKGLEWKKISNIKQWIADAGVKSPSL